MTPGTSLNGHHLRMLDTPMPDPVVKLVDRREGSPRGAPRSALLAAIAFAHARYRRALRDAQRATETADRRAALAEARRIITGATRLQSRLGSREP